MSEVVVTPEQMYQLLLDIDRKVTGMVAVQATQGQTMTGTLSGQTALPSSFPVTTNTAATRIFFRLS